MEFVIALGIAAFGYTLSSGPALEPVPPATYGPDVAAARAQEAAAAEQQFLDSLDPKRTGVVGTTPVAEAARTPEDQRGFEAAAREALVQHRLQPFFRSARTQTTSDYYKDRIHDLFSGSLMIDKSASGTYRNKAEAPAMFQPVPQAVTSSGSSGNPVCMPRLPTIGQKQNNVLPAQQIRVGPGVGVGPEVTAADGFHPQLRIMPNPKVWDYKINQLEARINIGANRNAMRSADPNVTVQRPPRVWDINRRPPEPTMAAVTARTSRPESGRGINMRCVDDRYEGDEYFGHARHFGPAAPDDATDNTRVRGDNNLGLPLTNVTGARHGTGGYSYASHDTQRIDAQQREQAGHEGTLTGDHRRAMATTGQIVQPTLRDTSGGYLGGAGHMVPTGATHLSDTARTTLRQTTAGPNDNGPAAPLKPRHMVQCTYQHLEKEAKRPTVDGYFTAPQRTTEFRRANLGSEADPWEMAGICKGKWVALKERAEANRMMSHGASHTMYLNMAAPGEQATPSNKLPEINRRQDFGLAQTVLKNNAYHVSIA
jgi:Family of unknown function (DUF5899)